VRYQAQITFFLFIKQLNILTKAIVIVMIEYYLSYSVIFQCSFALIIIFLK